MGYRTGEKKATKCDDTWGGNRGEVREQACVPLTFHDPPGSYCRLPDDQPEQKRTLDCLPGIKKLCGSTEM